MSTLVEWYNVVCKYFFICPALFCVPYFFIDAPFGRFSPSKPSCLLVDGIKSWIVMEIVSPLCFITAFLSSPLTRSLTSLRRFPLSPPPIYLQSSLAGFSFPVPNPPAILALLFLSHYANRALISPLRTPVRSKSHISVPICATFYNLINGSLMGAFLSALATPIGKPGIGAFLFRGSRTVIANRQFWAGISIWVVGFASNIWHDEILLNIRRQPESEVSRKLASSNKNDREGSKNTKPRYTIPHGGLYRLISYPNYLSEWFEWLGFAVSASALVVQLPVTHVVFPFVTGRISLGPLSDLKFIQSLTPPWLFLLSEIFLMLPRAWNGHKWYKRTFPRYPPARKAVIPFLL